MFTEKLVIITSMFASIIDVVSKVVIITSVKNVNSNEHALDCIGRRKEKKCKEKMKRFNFIQYTMNMQSLSYKR